MIRMENKARLRETSHSIMAFHEGLLSVSQDGLSEKDSPTLLACAEPSRVATARRATPAAQHIRSLQSRSAHSGRWASANAA